MVLPLRTQLLVSFLAIIVVCGAFSTSVGVSLVTKRMTEQAQDKVRLDLNSARVIYQQAVDEVRDAVRYTAARFLVREALLRGDTTRLITELEAVRTGESLDTFTLTDAEGVVLLRTRSPTVKGDSQAGNEVIRRALSSKSAVASSEIVTREELLKEGEDLAARARVRVAATPRAKPTNRTEETSGLMIVAAAPVLSAGGELLGLLCGGRLINRNYALVDRIRETVYQGEVYRGMGMGTATIFQGDLRISTNVLTAEGKRAIGTRVSEEVHERVLVEGKLWVERAFVVNDWYITAYEPIREVSGKVVGILYVGLLERKFVDMKRNTLVTFLGIMLGGMALSVAFCLLLTRTLVRPVNDLMLAAQGLASGDLTQQVDLDASTEEISALGEAFNSMAAAIKERDEELRRRAQEEIGKSEKLALVGRLAAGVAHEINNPLGGILLFSRLLLRKAPAEGIERENLERIAKEAERCKSIVQGLLDFARQREPEAETININDVVERSMSLLENQAIFHDIEIARRLAHGLPPVHADPSQMQQVFINIIMNAAEAMDGRGVLTVETRPGEAGRIDIRFEDTGRGIRAEDIKHLFEPFFTTKEAGQGTGLGLSISHGIIQSHGGQLRVSSELGRGTEFVVSLPTSQKET